MRDSGDPGTAELALPRRRGRPPVKGVTMTAAQRAADYRARRKHAAVNLGRLAGVDSAVAERVSTVALLDTLRDCFSSGDPVNGRRVLRVLAQRLSEMDQTPPPLDQ